MAYTPLPIVVQASAAKTATGQTGGLNSYLANPSESRNAVINLMATVTAVSGTTPTLDLSVQWSNDGGTTWAGADTADSFAQITATKNTVKQFAVKGAMFRVVYTIGGTTPSFTFSLTATAA